MLRLSTLPTFARSGRVHGMLAPYHHGNLRRALLDAALALFAERGSFDFTFRELARAAGVTHNAPYRHFAGRAELLAALREEGLERLAEASRLALVRAGDDPRARVSALGESYVRFALDQPVVFRLVLAHPLEDAEKARARGGESFRLLEATLTEAQAAGVVRADLGPRELALGAWALVHGAASLLASGHLPSGPARMKALIALLSTLFFDGAASARAKRVTRRR